ncbi:hypothetical protein IWW54_002525 [Coemansia sp. RSA 2705]|nr:hypothetical protein IWW54_002525 [Coemansia sp. RSA 2705]
MRVRACWLLAGLLADGAQGRMLELTARDGNVNESQAVSDPTSAWRTFSCMVPFTASDNTPFLMLYGGTATTGETNPLKVADKGTNSLQVFNMKNNRWYAPGTANAPKTGPVLPGCGADSGSIWVYDPQYSVADKASTSVSLLDSVHWSWSTPTQQGQLPVTRFGAAFAYVPNKQAFYMHGGIPLDDKTNTATSSSSAANNLDILSPNDLKWGYASNGPARMYHTMCYMKSIDSIVLFGGTDSGADSYNDVKLLSTSSNTWQYSLKIAGDAPAERLLHSAVCADDTMYVFGGVHNINDDPSDSTVWMLTANSSTEFVWSKAPISSVNQGTGPTARAGHSAAIYNGNMYIYGGVGSSGQDGAMYKLDLAKWQWSRTDVAGSSDDSQTSSKNKTAVLIAAIISSVLGVVVIGITATVLYRIIRRRNGTFLGRRQRSDDVHGALDSDDDQMPGAETTEQKENGDMVHGIHDSAAYAYSLNGQETNLSASGSHVQNPADITAASDRAPLPRFSPASNGSTAIIEPAGAFAVAGSVERGHARMASDRYASSNNESPVTTPTSVSGGQALLSPYRDGVGSSRHMLDTMRARARSLSNRIVPTRLSAAFSDTSAALASNTVGRRRRTNATSSTAANRRSAATSQTEANIYGPDYLRLENEYRQAEAINEILLSGQPIPAWLRDAVNQAQSDTDRQQSEQSGTATTASPAAESARQFTVANPDSKTN